MTKGDGLPCKRCGTSEWYDNATCKQCARDRASDWQRENPDRARKKRRRWAKKNRDGVLESSRKWKADNPDKVREGNQRYRKNNPEKRAKSVRGWQENNRDKVVSYAHNYRTRKTEAGGSYTAAEWKALKKQYSNRCACCGKKKKLEFDHVIPVTKGGTSDISNGQPLCRSCNASKGDKTTDYRTKPGLKRWIQNKLFS